MVLLLWFTFISSDKGFGLVRLDFDRSLSIGISQILLVSEMNASLRGKLLIQMFEKSSLRTRLSFYLAIKQLGGSTLTLRPDELHLSKGGESIEDLSLIHI